MYVLNDFNTMSVLLLLLLFFILGYVMTSTSDQQPSIAISNPSPGKSVLNKFITSSQYTIIYVAI